VNSDFAGHAGISAMPREYLAVNFLLPSLDQGVGPKIDRNGKILKKPKITSGNNFQIVAGSD